MNNKPITEAIYSSYKNKCCLETWHMKDELESEEYGRGQEGKACISDSKFDYLNEWNRNFSRAWDKNFLADNSLNQPKGENNGKS